MSSDADDHFAPLLTETLRGEAERVPLPPERYEWLGALAAGRSARVHGWGTRRLVLVAAAALCLFLLIGGLTPPGRVAARGVKRVIDTIASTITNGDSSTSNGQVDTRAVPQGSAQTGSVAAPTTSGTASAVAPPPPTRAVTATPVAATRQPTLSGITATPAVVTATPTAGGIPAPLRQPTIVPPSPASGTLATATPHEESKQDAPKEQGSVTASLNNPDPGAVQKAVPAVAHAPNKIATLPIPRTGMGQGGRPPPGKQSGR